MGYSTGRSRCVTMVGALIGFVLGCHSVALAGGMTLADLVGGQSITCQDLEFSKFTYDPSACADMPRAKDIMVMCIQGANGVGLSFTGVWTHKPDDGKICSARLSYEVHVKGDSSLGVAALMGTFSANAGEPKEGQVSVSESIFPLPCPD